MSSFSSDSSDLICFEEPFELPYDPKYAHEPQEGQEDEVRHDEVIDLTSLPDSDEEDDNDQEPVKAENPSPSIPKFTFLKQYRKSKLKRLTPPLAEHIYFSCFSVRSKKHYRFLQDAAKETYVGESQNPFLGKALFAAESISAGEFIMLYEGERFCYSEIDARQRGDRSADYAMYISKNVVVDALRETMGAGFANHSCSCSYDSA